MIASLPDDAAAVYAALTDNIYTTGPGLKLTFGSADRNVIPPPALLVPVSVRTALPLPDLTIPTGAATAALFMFLTGVDQNTKKSISVSSKEEMKKMTVYQVRLHQFMGVLPAGDSSFSPPRITLPNLNGIL